jgi:A/G-specific adenine glycosylase
MKDIPNTHLLKKTKEVKYFHNSLLRWYDEYQRDLPWRSQPSLYKTVISEFMLQQTRISTALPYYESWLKKFPDFKTLANATEEEVIKAWEGLGYYSRARNLHKLANIASLWKTPPDNLKEWKKLPGVGPYIAAAVTSIAMGKPVAVCDGNLVRVLTRIFAIDKEYKDGATAQKKLLPISQSILNMNRPGDHNQAMMELGATVCHRHSPLCLTCPIVNFCGSGRAGNPENFPKIQKKKKKEKSMNRFWVESNGKLLLQTDINSKSKLSGIYELPQALPSCLKFSPKAVESIGTRKRTIGNVEYKEEILRILRFVTKQDQLEKGYLWVDNEKMKELTLSGPHRKWIEEIIRESTENS